MLYQQGPLEPIAKSLQIEPACLSGLGRRPRLILQNQGRCLSGALSFLYGAEMKNEHIYRPDKREESDTRKSHPVIEMGRVIVRNESYKRSDKSWKKDLEEEKNT